MTVVLGRKFVSRKRKAKEEMVREERKGRGKPGTLRRFSNSFKKARSLLFQ
jgi:hypothetical protein